MCNFIINKDVNATPSSLIQLLLLLRGIEVNPGPGKYPCDTVINLLILEDILHVITLLNGTTKTVLT